MRIFNESLTLNSTSMSANITSDPIYLGHIGYYSIQLVYTGTPDGTFKLQLSNDMGSPQAAEQANEDFKIVNWTDIANTTVAVSAAGDLSYNVENAGYRWVRVVWTADSAGTTPVLTSARANGKGV